MKIQNENVHHGARFIDAKSISQLIPGIDNIGNDIKQFRSVAYNHNKRLKSNKHSNELNNLAPEKFNNTISIIGQRGDGKTSAMMTFIEEIKKGTYFKDNKREEKKENIKINKCDIITRIIDPDEIGKSSDLLGWVIACIGEYLESYSKSDQNEDKCYQDCIHLQGMHQKISELETKLNVLHKLYTSSKKEYSNLIYSKSNSLNEYSDRFKAMLTNDYQFSQNFHNLITELIDFKRIENKKFNYEEIEAEPLIYFFFDDVDTSSKYCPEILINILTFLCHPNIVVCVSGDYEIFERSVTGYLLDTEVYLEKDYKKELETAQTRSEFFLKKALPSSYRYRIVNYTNEILFNMSYSSKKTTNPKKLEEFNILQLISFVFGLGFIDDEKSQKGGYLKSFIIPNINEKGYFLSDDKVSIDNDYYFCDSNKKTNYVYAYLSVFGKNVRSFVNVYNYLYSEAISVCENQNEKKQTISEYWNTDRFSEFINIIIESKFTYLKHRSDINKFLSIKYDKIENSNNNNNVRNLRIDCEELEILVNKILNEEKKTILNDKQGEINSLIMLAIFINEVFYHIHRENYYYRYNRIVYKLKNILCKVLINAQNTNIQLLPTTLDLRRTLCIYYRIISRMSIETLNKIVYPDFNNMDNVSRITTKKYFVQLYYAIILLITADQNKEALLKDIRINDLKEQKTNDLINFITVNNLYDLYEKSTYQENILYPINRKIQRDDFEKVIIKCLKNFFDIHRDTNWFNDKIIYVKNMYPSIDSIVSSIEKKYLNSYLEYLDNTAIDKIVNIKKNIYKLSDKENFVEKLIDLLNYTIKNHCATNHMLLNNSEMAELIKLKIEDLKIFSYELIEEADNNKADNKDDNKDNKDDKDDNKATYYRNILMKFKRQFEIQLKSYLNAVETRNKTVVKSILSNQKKIIIANIELYYLLIFIIEYEVSYKTPDAKFFLNLKEGIAKDE
ncbi:hypothetical protein [Thomasclavelia cocleata]|uniref:hypothetical protein n=1 Tax=Thomasclavelia cocleata TaxID=69824 RepID=UPI00261E37AF|nr:hypothetical protein [Thomasclavelia cocleata]